MKIKMKLLLRACRSCLVGEQLRVQIWTNVNAQTLSLIAPTKIVQINVLLNQS